ncbi:hypothetical protein V496_04206 [Pseudogymnoascus sp. VKM F-4515 (FW-2607)]|nr:hypothetical protein V496_04206 [Pseudogymnoascus sp. VKM F-4515 (FW-2607)]
MTSQNDGMSAGAVYSNAGLALTSRGFEWNGLMAPRPFGRHPVVMNGNATLLKSVCEPRGRIKGLGPQRELCTCAF